MRSAKAKETRPLLTETERALLALASLRTHRSLRVAVSEKDRAIPDESADPEQNDRDEGIDLQGVVRQLGGDRTGEVARRANKPQLHRGRHDKQRRERNFHHAEQSKITSDPERRHPLDHLRTP